MEFVIIRDDFTSRFIQHRFTTKKMCVSLKMGVDFRTKTGSRGVQGFEMF